MKLLANVLLAVLLNALICFGGYAQDQQPESEEKEYTDDGWSEIKKYSNADKKKECNKYEGKYISYYDDVYKVEKCKRRPVVYEENMRSLSLGRLKITPVQSDTIAKIDLGKPINMSAPAKKRGCKFFNKKYVTVNYSDIYYVENCVKRHFPDWETYTDHKKKHGNSKAEIFGVSWDEFESIKEGKTFNSVIDLSFVNLNPSNVGQDIIPLKEACKGLNGKDVSYVDRIYRIENCKKREYDAQKYMKSKSGRTVKLKELTSSQWLSIPDGKRMNI